MVYKDSALHKLQFIGTILFFIICLQQQNINNPFSKIAFKSASPMIGILGIVLN